MNVLPARMHTCIYVCAPHACLVPKVRDATGLLELELLMVVSHHVLGTIPGASGRAAGALNCPWKQWGKKVFLGSPLDFPSQDLWCQHFKQLFQVSFFFFHFCRQGFLVQPWLSWIPFVEPAGLELTAIHLPLHPWVLELKRCRPNSNNLI